MSWSFGSPTIATRPPYERTTSFSGTVGRVVGALAVNVGMQRVEEASDVVLLEDDDMVHRAQGGHEQGAVPRRHHRPPLALQAAHRGVAVDPDRTSTSASARAPWR